MNLSQQKLDTVTEDALECTFFSLAKNDKTYWENMQCDVKKYIQSMCSEYIWHKEAFDVLIPPVSSKGLPQHMYSITSFGANIEDEWFIIFLVFEITKLFKDLVVKVIDTDGDFILIEAADVLPKWANPDTTENRVYIHDGNIHIINTELIPLDDTMTIEDALKCIKNSNTTKAPNNIQEAIKKRISGYPEKKKDNIHKAIVELPTEIAAILEINPQFISTIVDEYCNIDSASKVNILNDDFMSDIITVSVTFTKCLYAMLMHSKLIKHHLHPNTNDKKQHLGLKLSYGYRSLKNKKVKDVFALKAFDAFLLNLKNANYFQGSIEGSQKYVNLLDQAKLYYKNLNYSQTNTNIETIISLLNSEKFINTKLSLIRNKEQLVEDSDDWLIIQPEQLNELLTERYGKTTNNKNDIITPQIVTDQLTNFLKETSSIEGIESQQRKLMDDNVIDFDSDLFIEEVTNILNGINSNKSDSESSDFEDNEEAIDQIIQNEINTEIKDLKIGNKSNFKDTFINLSQSLKEEKASVGPSSNLLSNIGIHKNYILLDSDDDEE